MMSNTKDDGAWNITLRTIVPLAYQAQQLHKDIELLLQLNMKDVPEWLRMAHSKLLERATQLAGSPDVEYGHASVQDSDDLSVYYMACGQISANLFAYLTNEEKKEAGIGFHADMK